MINLKSSGEIEAIARGGAIIAGLLREVEARIAPGTSTAELDAFCDEYIVSHEGARPAFKGLYGFPGSVCVSLNDEVVHGIPSARRILAEGDIVSIDVGVKLDGWCSDSAWTFPVGEVDPGTARLLRVTEEALERAVEAARRGNHVGDIGAAVVRAVEGTSFGIIRDLVGHGVGREVHEDPQVPNVGRPGYGPLLRTGMVLAIEPMLSAGSERIRTLEDRWTVVTADGARSAHFEHTVAVTDEGPRILTGALESVTPGSGDAPDPSVRTP
ncbi:MAG TPA: type I methionyl aminopeptidase [Longimicrobiales bacterium]|nr:type I methionyl aminopeptidase [Longimicrobiales bacterium]